MIMDSYQRKETQEVVRQSSETVLRTWMRNNDEMQSQVSLEKKVMGMVPEQFIHVLDKIAETQKDWNSHLKSCTYILDHPDKGGADITQTLIKAPAPFMSGRVFFDARYIFKYEKTGALFAIFSSKGNEQITKDFKAKNNLDEVVAYTVISGHMYTPIKDSNNITIGTHIFYLTESNFGGKLPEWIAKSFIPKAIMDTYDSIVKYAKTNFDKDSLPDY